MNTMFCLVSRQAMANVLPVLMYKPQNVVLFTTPEEKSCADNLEKLFKSKRISVKRNDGLNAYDYLGFKDAVKKELDCQQGELWLNVTGGTKLMALAAYEAFAEKEKPVIYCNTERNQMINIFPNISIDNLKLELSSTDYLHSYGYEVIETKNNLLKKEYLEIFDLLESNNILLKFSDFLDEYRSETGTNISIKTYNDKKNKIFTVQKTPNGILLFVNKKKFKFEDDKFLKGEWLEYYALFLLNKKGITADVGVKIKSENNVENEIDLMFVKDYKLFLISCKSGKNTDPNKDIYEIETLRNIAGGTYGQAFLFTTKPLTERITKRAKELNIKTVCITSEQIF